MEVVPDELKQLRDLVDATDQRILEQVAERMALVAKIGAAKRAAGLRVRDRERERIVLQQRRALANALGLPQGEVDTLMRLLLRLSRERQAQLRVEVLPTEARKTITIIGGNGKMGRLLATMFQELGHAILVVDLDTQLSIEEGVATADVVVLSVPIERTVEIAERVGPLLAPHALLMDITSVKSSPMEAMLRSTSASVVGTHPMFGPNIHTLQGQRVVLCRGRGDDHASWVRHAFEARGLLVTETTAERHDRIMAVVQVLTHFQTQAMGLTLARFGVPLRESLHFTSPAYLLELYATGRHFAQSAQLYGAIEMRNPRTQEVTQAFGAAVQELSDVIARKDLTAFEQLFAEVRTFFGDFTSEALEQSSYLIDRIVERAE